MKTIGWIYLGSVLLDSVVSWVATYVPAAVTASNQLSLVVTALTLFAFVFAVVGKLKPRGIFFGISAFYCVMMVVSTVVMVALTVEKGPGELQNMELDPAKLSATFPWYAPVHLAMLSIWTLLAILALLAYGRAGHSDPDIVEADRAVG